MDWGSDDSSKVLFQRTQCWYGLEKEKEKKQEKEKIPQKEVSFEAKELYLRSYLRYFFSQAFQHRNCVQIFISMSWLSNVNEQKLKLWKLFNFHLHFYGILDCYSLRQHEKVVDEVKLKLWILSTFPFFIFIFMEFFVVTTQNLSISSRM